MIITNNETILRDIDGVNILTFRKLDCINFIRHAFSTKIGGVSKGDFESMNLSFSRGDDESAVIENYRRFFRASECTLDNLIMSDQIHKTDVFVINEESIKTFDKDFTKRKLTAYDGMVTNLKNVPLVTYYADCVPLFFVDEVHKAIGLSHSGWRGTVAGMAIKTIETMNKEYGTKPADICTVIGPSICKKCYEVSSEVIDAVIVAYKDKFDLSDIFYKKSNGKYQFDLWQLNKEIMIYAGIPEKNITISGICTSCNSDLLFSHRVTNGRRGNLAAVMEIVK